MNSLFRIFFFATDTVKQPHSVIVSSANRKPALTAGHIPLVVACLLGVTPSGTTTAWPPDPASRAAVVVVVAVGVVRVKGVLCTGLLRSSWPGAAGDFSLIVTIERVGIPSMAVLAILPPPVSVIFTLVVVKAVS